LIKAVPGVLLNSGRDVKNDVELNVICFSLVGKIILIVLGEMLIFAFMVFVEHMELMIINASGVTVDSKQGNENPSRVQTTQHHL